MDIIKIKRAFGLRCRVLRDERGLSQEVFARMIKMDRSYYASIETGMRNVTLNNMARIAQGFEISLSELVKGIEIG